MYVGGAGVAPVVVRVFPAVEVDEDAISEHVHHLRGGTRREATRHTHTRHTQTIQPHTRIHNTKPQESYFRTHVNTMHEASCVGVVQMHTSLSPIHPPSVIWPCSESTSTHAHTLSLRLSLSDTLTNTHLSHFPLDHARTFPSLTHNTCPAPPPTSTQARPLPWRRR